MTLIQKSRVRRYKKVFTIMNKETQPINLREAAQHQELILSIPAKRKTLSFNFYLRIISKLAFFFYSAATSFILCAPKSLFVTLKSIVGLDQTFKLLLICNTQKLLHKSDMQSLRSFIGYIVHLYFNINSFCC